MMKFIKFLRFDLRNGVGAAWKKYLIAIAFFVFIGRDFLSRCAAFEPKQDFTLGDFSAFFFAGMREYVPSIYEPFRFPALWVLMYALLLYITLYYTDDDMHGFGQHTMLHSGGRGAWWLSKCAWNIICVLLFFSLAWCVMLIVAFCSGHRLSLEISPYMELFLEAGDDCAPAAEWALKLELLALPPLVAVALSLFQMTLSLFIKPVFSYIFSLTYLLSSVYYVSPFLLGNYAMVLRSNQIIDNGVSPVVGVIYALAVGVGSAAVGYIKFRRHNILGKEDF